MSRHWIKADLVQKGWFPTSWLDTPRPVLTRGATHAQHSQVPKLICFAGERVTIAYTPFLHVTMAYSMPARVSRLKE